ncbi:hypothetical protein AB0M83_07610 [Amycolatopsis sp. NPDC051106]|uniref:hypothetical protein n=1 Tax=unclassified Amycolatopsis TaxID=2618356 RepID=UPI003418289F
MGGTVKAAFRLWGVEKWTAPLRLGSVEPLRRQGVGLAAAAELLRSRRGRWAIAFLEENAPAARFWRQVATEVVGERWTQELRRHPDGVHTFTFLHADVDQDGRVLH